MHEIAESGVASHWSYKEKTNGKIKTTLEERLETFRTLIESKDIDNNMDFFKNINNELKSREIYAFTPKGDVIELPYGSTPIDFAYKIHSEVGNQTISALANNKMVKLDYIIEDGDIIELNTKKGSTPNKNWLKFVKTDQAKSRIRSFFYKKERDKNILLGKEMLEEECKKRSLDFNELFNNENLDKLLQDLKIDSVDDLYFNISILRFLPNTLINRLLPKKEKDVKFNSISSTSNNDVLVEGSDDILTSFASCCNPVYGEEIVGYVTKGNGIKIHSKNCPNVDNLEERFVSVRWNENVNNRYKVILNIYVISNIENISNIITIATKNDVYVEGFNLKNNFDDSSYYETILKVKNIEDLNKFIEELRKLSNILKVERSFN
jgi:GTP pyrophosphokinase